MPANKPPLELKLELPQSEIRKAINAADRFTKQLRHELWQHIHAYAEKMWQEARRQVPVLTGNLRSTLEIILKRTALEALVGTWKTTYAIFVELGTRYQKAQPYLRPALEKYRDGFFRGLKDIVERANRKK